MSNPATGYSTSDTTSDPVCGAAVGDDSPFHATIGNQQIYFCSRACQELFGADPEQYMASAISLPDAADLATPRSEAAGLESPRAADDPPSTFGLAQAVGEVRSGVEPQLLAPAPRSSPGFFERLLPGRQRRFVRRVSREMQVLHGAVSQDYPALRGLNLYRRIVMERMHIDQDGADQLLRKTDENFAWWPTTREITFIDVVHMIAMQEYHTAYGKSPWVRADMALIIAEEIDHAL